MISIDSGERDISFTQLNEFLKSRAGSLESFECWKTEPVKVSKPRSVRLSTTLLATQVRQDSCPVYSNISHRIYHYSAKAISLHSIRYHKKHRLCFNYFFSYNHPVHKCKSQSCKRCEFNHQSMLHGLPFKKAISKFKSSQLAQQCRLILLPIYSTSVILKFQQLPFQLLQHFIADQVQLSLTIHSFGYARRQPWGSPCMKSDSG